MNLAVAARAHAGGAFDVRIFLLGLFFFAIGVAVLVIFRAWFSPVQLRKAQHEISGTVGATLPDLFGTTIGYGVSGPVTPPRPTGHAWAVAIGGLGAVLSTGGGFMTGTSISLRPASSTHAYAWWIHTGIVVAVVGFGLLLICALIAIAKLIVAEAKAFLHRG